jgi:hypothetical protein
LLAPLLAAPSGPYAMCFLRPARGFGWLDPRLNRSPSTPSRPHHHAHSNTTQTGAVAVEFDAGECEKCLGGCGARR